MFSSTSLLRVYESISNEITSHNKDFCEWFSGITDAEGTFTFKKYTVNNAYSFTFKISLHVHDIHTLYFIRDTLQFGKIVEEKSKREQLNTWRFIVTKLEEIKKIIRIFDQYQLNSTKLLNFLNFKEAFEIYINSAKTPELVEKLASASPSARRGGNKNLGRPYSVAAEGRASPFVVWTVKEFIFNYQKVINIE
jgi:hypothetical protein